MKMYTIKRKRFLKNIILESILPPYEVDEAYEEELIGEFQNGVERTYFDHFIKLVGLNGFILDLACGDGRHTLRLSEKMRYVTALDLSSKQLYKARIKCQLKENISFIRGSMFNLPFREKIFDGIWLSQAFEYVPPDMRDRFIEYIIGILKSGGILFMSVETWLYPSFLKSIKNFMKDFMLYLYWKFLKRKPLLWGEYLYKLTVNDGYTIYHYHVHTDKRTLLKPVKKHKLKILDLDLHDGYIYILYRKYYT
ncbi:MAG: hypothetical protein DRJ32_03085 [Thermoprotei archaeon]|nr:MAG: hypothetical protein DRJ32_03085 [Thermoprotei archaeon]